MRRAALCRCPYCDAPLVRDSFVCAPCQVKLVALPNCGKPGAEVPGAVRIAGTRNRPVAVWPDLTRAEMFCIIAV